MARINVAGRQPSRTLDVVHIIIGIVIVVMAVMAFIDPTENMVLFPLIFFAAAILKIVSGASTILNAKRAHEHTSPQGTIELGIGILIAVLGVVSAVSVWYS